MDDTAEGEATEKQRSNGWTAGARTRLYVGQNSRVVDYFTTQTWTVPTVVFNCDFILLRP
jgi:uncharacterized protein YraI